MRSRKLQWTSLDQVVSSQFTAVKITHSVAKTRASQDWLDDFSHNFSAEKAFFYNDFEEGQDSPLPRMSWSQAALPTLDECSGVNAWVEQFFIRQGSTGAKCPSQSKTEPKESVSGNDLLPQTIQKPGPKASSVVDERGSSDQTPVKLQGIPGTYDGVRKEQLSIALGEHLSDVSGRPSVYGKSLSLQTLFTPPESPKPSPFKSKNQQRLEQKRRAKFEMCNNKLPCQRDALGKFRRRRLRKVEKAMLIAAYDKDTQWDEATYQMFAQRLGVTTGYVRKWHYDQCRLRAANKNFAARQTQF